MNKKDYKSHTQEITERLILKTGNIKKVNDGRLTLCVNKSRNKEHFNGADTVVVVHWNDRYSYFLFRMKQDNINTRFQRKKKVANFFLMIDLI